MLSKLKNHMEQHLNTWYLIVMGVIVFCILGFLYVSQGLGVFVFNEHLEDTAFEVEGEKVTLKEAAYYLMVIESNVNAFAIEYNTNDPRRYWNVYLNDGDKRSNFLSKQAKEDAMRACVRDEIYYQEALKAGIELDSEDKRVVEDEAYEQQMALTGKMVHVTQYEYSDMYAMVSKIAVVKKYMVILMAEGYTEEQLDFGGEYYENVKEGYDVWVNEDMWEEISLGALTIN